MTEKKGISRHAVRILIKVMAVICIFTVLSRISASLTVAEVLVESPSAKRIEHIVDGEGVIGAQLETSVQTEAGLLIKNVHVKKGQKVETGEVLAELDPEDLAEAKRKLEEEWEILHLANQELLETQKKEEAKAQLAQERAKEDYEQAAKESEVSLQTAAAELKRAQDQYNGYAATLQGQTTDEQFLQLLELQAAAEAAQRAYHAAVLQQEDILRKAQRAVEDAGEEQAGSASAAINEIKLAQLERQKKKLLELEEAGGKLVAPQAGMITEVYIQTGQRTTDTAAVTLTDTSAGLYYTAEIEKDELDYAAVGDAVVLKKEGKERGSFQIDAIEMMENGNALVTVRMDAEAAEEFRLGEALSMEIRQEALLHSSTVPVTALHEENGQYYVYVTEQVETVLGEEYRARRIEVELLDKNDSYAAIEEGTLAKDAQVIVDSSRYIDAGSKVRLQKP